MNGMTANHDFDRLVVDWLDETAGSGAPDYLGEALARIEGVRQRPAWMSPGRWLPMRALTLRRFETPRFTPFLVVLGLLLALAIAILIAAGSQRRLPPPFGLAATGSVAYDAGGDLYIASVDGASVTRLTSTADDKEFGAVWSRDGTRLAFASAPVTGGAASLWVMSHDARTPRKVSGNLELAADEIMPVASWSPDGRRIVFTAGQFLYVVGADGSGLHQLAGVREGSWPSWSPRGDLIAFLGAGGTTAVQGVHVVSPDGGPPAKVSTRSGGAIELIPQWSPDGSRLLYHAGSNGDVLLATLGDSGWTESVLAGGPTNDSWPTWSNDGSRISFIRSLATDHGYVMVADADGSNAHPLESDVIGWAPHCWTPDDRGILAVTAEENLGIGDEPRPGYVVLAVDGQTAPVVISTAGRQAFAACSWQRLAP